MSTYGEVRAHLNKVLGGMDLDILDALIAARYTEILDMMPWQRLEVQSIVQTALEYSTGTVEVVKGSTAVVGTGTAWSSGMTGYIFRIGSDNCYYEFIRSSETEAALDRPYEGESGSALAYRLNKNIYQLSADLRILHGIENISQNFPLKKISLTELQQLDPSRSTYGSPIYYCPYMDTWTSPPTTQVELYPVPTTIESLLFTYVADAQPLAGTSYVVAPWVRPGALYAGVQADVARMRGQNAIPFENRFKELVSVMARIEAAKRGPVSIKVASNMVDHQRWRER